MRQVYIFSSAVFFLFSGITFGSNNECTIQLQNPISQNRTDEMIVIQRESLVIWFGGINTDEIVVAYDGKQAIPSQCDDLNLDGIWDELAFLVDLKSDQVKEIVLQKVDKTAIPVFKNRTNIRFGKPFKKESKVYYTDVDSAVRIGGYANDSTKIFPQFEGPGWENDKIAFRNYLDERNGIDIFGKTTTEMVLDSVGIGHVYHHLQSWGMDILKVGKSLGAGSIAVFYKNKLYRVSAIEGASFKKITEGPVRAILDLDFKYLNFDNLKLGLKHRITIVAGEYGYRSTVYLLSPSDTCYVATGLVNLHNKELFTLSVSDSKIFYTYDKQSENNDTLGMSIILDKQKLLTAYKTPNTGEDITNTYVIVMKPAEKNCFYFYFMAGWERSDEIFKMKSSFEGYLKNQISLKRNSIKVIHK